MTTMDDFGAGPSGQDTDDYEVYYRSELEPGDTFKGEIFMSDIRVSEAETTYGQKLFNIVITNHDLEEKWIITYWSPNEDALSQGNYYGKKGGAHYVLIDSILSCLFDTPRDEAKYHTVVFEKFREGVNSRIGMVEAEMLEPRGNGKHPVLSIASVEEVGE